MLQLDSLSKLHIYNKLPVHSSVTLLIYVFMIDFFLHKRIRYCQRMRSNTFSTEIGI